MYTFHAPHWDASNETSDWPHARIPIQRENQKRAMSIDVQGKGKRPPHKLIQSNRMKQNITRERERDRRSSMPMFLWLRRK